MPGAKAMVTVRLLLFYKKFVQFSHLYSILSLKGAKLAVRKARDAYERKSKECTR